MENTADFAGRIAAAKIQMSAAYSAIQAAHASVPTSDYVDGLAQRAAQLSADIADLASFYPLVSVGNNG